MLQQLWVVCNFERYRAVWFDIGLGFREIKWTFGPGRRYALYCVCSSYIFLLRCGLTLSQRFQIMFKRGLVLRGEEGSRECDKKWCEFSVNTFRIGFNRHCWLCNNEESSCHDFTTSSRPNSGMKYMLYISLNSWSTEILSTQFW